MVTMVVAAVIIAEDIIRKKYERVCDTKYHKERVLEQCTWCSTGTGK